MSGKRFVRCTALCLTVSVLLTGRAGKECTVAFDANWDAAAAIDRQTVRGSEAE